MHDSTFRFGFLVLVLMFYVFACSSVKEFRSPIVFRSPVVLKSDEEKKPEAPPSPAPSSVTTVAKEEPVQAPPALEAKKEGEKKQAPAATATPSPARTTKEPESEISMPADIPVFSPPDLANYRVSTLGKIQVSARSKAGFSQETALKQLKVEAFRRYGSSAQGITSVELKEAEGEAYHKVSGDVIMVSPKQVTTEEGGALPLTPPAEPRVEAGSPGKTSSEFPIDRVQILTSDQVYQRKFRILGKVSAVDKKVGFTKDEAIRELKIEAIKAYGSQAKGLLDVKLEKPARVFYYTKVRKPISTPEESKNYERASAEVVVWD